MTFPVTTPVSELGVPTVGARMSGGTLVTAAAAARGCAVEVCAAGVVVSAVSEPISRRAAANSTHSAGDVTGTSEPGAAAGPATAIAVVPVSSVPAGAATCGIGAAAGALLSADGGATAGAVGVGAGRRGVRSTCGRDADVGASVASVADASPDCLREPGRFRTRAGFPGSSESDADPVGVGRVGALGADDVGPESPGAVVEPPEGDEVFSPADDEEVESVSDGSAHAGPAATADPMPSATANAPTRPIYLAEPTVASSFC